MALVGLAMLVIAQTTDVDQLAQQAGVDPGDLAAAAASTGLDAREYLYAVGELARPVADRYAIQAECIEAAESGGANVWNRGGSGAGGVMQYFPGTFARGAKELGHPEWSLWVPWQARLVAAHDLAMGRRAQWTVGGCR